MGQQRLQQNVPANWCQQTRRSARKVPWSINETTSSVENWIAYELARDMAQLQASFTMRKTWVK